jgi:hypothetical protein
MVHGTTPQAAIKAEMRSDREAGTNNANWHELLVSPLAERRAMCRTRQVPSSMNRGIL